MNIMVATFVLVTVTSSGGVSSSKYDDVHACQEAKNIAMTGLTIEEEKSRQDAQEVAELAFERAHPPRLPANDGEKAIAATGGSEGGTEGSFRTVGGGLIQDEGPMYGLVLSYDNGSMIKTALCLEDVGAND